MATLIFQEGFEQWEGWQKVMFTPDGIEKDMVYFKMGDEKRQIKVRMHVSEMRIFINNLELPPKK